MLKCSFFYFFNEFIFKINLFQIIPILFLCCDLYETFAFLICCRFFFLYLVSTSSSIIFFIIVDKIKSAPYAVGQYENLRKFLDGLGWLLVCFQIVILVFSKIIKKTSNKTGCNSSNTECDVHDISKTDCPTSRGGNVDSAQCNANGFVDYM